MGLIKIGAHKNDHTKASQKTKIEQKVQLFFLFFNYTVVTSLESKASKFKQASYCYFRQGTTGPIEAPALERYRRNNFSRGSGGTD